MKSIKLIAVTCLLTGLAACNTDKEIATYEGAPNAIQIEAVIGSAYSRTNPEATEEQQKLFNEGDEITLKCEDGSMTYKLTEGKWTPTDNYYLRWGTEPTTYSAYYPTADNTSELNFTLPANQKTLDGMAKADYMTCTVENATDDGSHVLRLFMNRKMAKVIMTLTDVDDEKRAQGVTIGSYPGFTDGNVTAGSSQITPFVTVPEGGKAGQNGCTYTAIVTPGEADPAATFVSLNYSGEEMVLPGIPALEAGKCYEFTLYVNGTMLSLSDPIVSDWTEGTMQGGEAEYKFDTYFVKATSTGDASGTDWDNAMGPEEFRTLLTDETELSGSMIYVSEGTYLMSETEGIGPTIKKNMNIMGGYSEDLTGKDVSTRNITDNTTIFSGDVNNNQTADEGDCGLMLIEDGMVSFDGITFQNGYVNDTNADEWAAGLYIEGNAVVSLTDCVIQKCKSTANTSANQGGAAIRMNGGQARLDRVQLLENESYGRGGAVRCLSGVMFMNRCLVKGNNLNGDAWGFGINMAGHLCMNNTTMIDNDRIDASGKGIGATLNADGSMLLINSTFIYDGTTDYEGLIRCSTATQGSTQFINNLLLNGRNPDFNLKVDNSSVLSKGWNIYKTISDNMTSKMLATDTKVTSLTGTENNGIYEWTISTGSPSMFATTSNVIEAAKAYNPNNSPISNLGAAFVEWVGEDGFGVDQRGEKRNPNKMQPGAYDANLSE